ncbi:MAG: CHAT domain-containing protein [Hyphomicrobiaceae bacterium]|nr:MAG: CHAT domain-containing protein [Hyphomicrobiaceae bacterium]
MVPRRLSLIAWLLASLLLAASAEAQNPVIRELQGLWKKSLEAYNAGRYAESEAFAKQSIARATAVFGPDHRATSRGYHNLARVYLRTGRFQEAETISRKALAIREKMVGPDSVPVAATLTQLGWLMIEQGRYPEAEPMLKRAVAIYEKVPTPESPWSLGLSLSNLGYYHMAIGQWQEAETILTRGVAVQEKATGAESVWTSRIVSRLALAKQQGGKTAEAEALFKRAIATLERLGNENAELGANLGRLAWLYVFQGRVVEAEPMFRRAIAAQEKGLGRDNSLTSFSLRGLGNLMTKTGRFAEAEAVLKEALAIDEKAHGPNHPQVGADLANLANLANQTNRLDEALAWGKRAVAIREAAFGQEHHLTLLSLNILGETYLKAGRLEEAETTVKRTAAGREKVLGPTHFFTAESWVLLGRIHLAQQRHAEALAAFQKASSIIDARSRSSAGFRAKQHSDEVGVGFRRFAHGWVVFAAWQLAKRDPARVKELMNEAFLAAQLSENTAASAALNQMAVRFGAGTGPLAELLRQGQDIANRWQDIDRQLTQSIGEQTVAVKSNAEERARARRELDRLSGELETLSRRIAKEFPEYASLAHVEPVSIKSAQEALSDHQALVAVLSNGPATTTFVVTRQEARWYRSTLTQAKLAEKVEKLRCGLEAEAWTEEKRRERCKELGLKLTSAELLPYDLAEAHKLYEDLFGPLQPMLNGKSLVIVPSGPLTSLPLHALLTEKPAEAFPADAMGYRRASWLAKSNAVTVLPSVQSIAALKLASARTKPSKSLIGIAAPDFQGTSTAPPPQSPATKRAVTQQFAAFFKGNRADLELLKSSLAPLPETKDEILAVARKVGAEEKDILLGPAATKASIKSLPLGDYRIVYFATHGLIAGEIEGLGEPALALTMPSSGDADEGLLTASDVAQLKLNADWVVLSACNTAAGNRPGAEALSGLARSFFYAGARSLLVSHWKVSSVAAVKLTTAAFDALAADTTIDKAEALRRSMIAMIEKDDVEMAHPSNWAPFVLVGDGAK